MDVFKNMIKKIPQEGSFRLKETEEVFLDIGKVLRYYDIPDSTIYNILKKLYDHTIEDYWPWLEKN